MKMQLRGRMENKPRRALIACAAAMIFIITVLSLLEDPFLKPNYIYWHVTIRNRRAQHLPVSTKLPIERLMIGTDLSELEATGFSCSSDYYNTEICVINKPVIFDKQSRSLYATSNDRKMTIKRKIKPYPRLINKLTMERVSPVFIHHGIVSSNKPPGCQFRHEVAALVFSFGGCSDNTFHVFNEILIPLYITSRHFGSQIQFVITDYRARWIRKYERFLKELSSYEIINADDDPSVHCFPAAIVGLRYHGNLALNSSAIPTGNTIAGFRQLLSDTYLLKRQVIKKPRKPKLLLLSRENSRKILNEHAVVKMMEELGFQVLVALPSEMVDLEKFSETVNSCDVMVGVHGAGLTNEIFLPNGAVVVQIVAWGLEWPSEAYFGKPTIDMGLKYVEYKIDPNETTLYKVYGPNHPVITDPISIWNKGFMAVKDMYVDGQDVKINIDRFRNVLMEAVKLI